MNQTDSAFRKILLTVMVLSLTACSGEVEPSVSPEASTPASAAVTAPATETHHVPEETRPQSANFDLMTSDGNQSLTAALHQGEGYSLYVFEKFTFNAAEGRLFLNSHPDYEVEIESLPANYDLTQLETAGKEELEKFGEVADYSGELVEHPLGFAKLYLQASSSEGINDYIVWQAHSGDTFLFRIHNPKGEEASDFAGPVLVSLSTVQSSS